MNKHHEQQLPMIGGSSLLVIFAVLCLTVFALLGFSTVQADKRLADVSIQAVSNYYAADCAAEEVLARLKSGELPEGVSKMGDVYVYSCTISPTQSLQIEVRGSDWAILRWQAVSTTDWKENTDVELWNGNQ